MQNKKPYKIMYVCNKRDQERVFEPFRHRPDVEQVLTSPTFIKIENPGIRYIRYNYREDFKQILKKEAPNAVVQCDCSDSWHAKLTKYGMKKVYVAHGVHDGSAKIISLLESEPWNSFDVLFGGLPSFSKLLTKHAGVAKNKIFTNTLPQLDVLYDRMQNDKANRSKIIKRSGFFDATKVITIFCPRWRKDFESDAMDYYSAMPKIMDMAIRNNWLIVVKPKKEGELAYLTASEKEGKDWAKEYCKPYLNMREAKYPNFMMLSNFANSYDYFCSNAIICIGRSTVEMEACMANKPLITIRTSDKLSANYDTLGIIKNNCTYLVDDLTNLEGVLTQALNSSNIDQIKNQREYISKSGLTFDGKHCERIVNTLKQL